MAEIKVGQKYKRAGNWANENLAEQYCVVARISEDRVNYVYDSGRDDFSSEGVFFANVEDFNISYHPSAFVLVPEEQEDNQLSPNAYQFPNGVEVRHISAHLSSFGGQAVQYIARATRLDGVVKGLPVQDLKKAIQLLEWEVGRLEAGK